MGDVFRSAGANGTVVGVEVPADPPPKRDTRDEVRFYLPATLLEPWLSDYRELKNSRVISENCKSASRALYVRICCSSLTPSSAVMSFATRCAIVMSPLCGLFVADGGMGQCMLDWLGLHKKRTCPECRAIVKGQPAPAYVVRPSLVPCPPFRTNLLTSLLTA